MPLQGVSFCFLSEPSRAPLRYTDITKTLFAMPMLTLLFLFLTLLCLYMIFLYFVRLLSNRSGSRYADVRVRTA